MTFPRVRLWLLCALSGGCFGGPISDFPSASTEGGPSGGYQPSPNAGQDQDVDVVDRDPTQPEAPPTATPGDSNGGDGNAPGDPTGDGGEGEPLPTTPQPECGVHGADGGCQGSLCGVTRGELESMVMPGGACVTDTGELALVCDETLARVVGGCTQSALAQGSLTSVQECAVNDPALAAASDDCVACYVQDNECMLANCLVDCVLSGAAEACQLCRHTHCAESFSACSGLPSEPMLVAPDVSSP